MKTLSSTLSLIIAYVLLVSCTNHDDVFQSSLSGVWKLTNWNVATPFDLNNDGVSNINLLSEFGCLNGSELIFKDASNASLYYTSKVAFNVENENDGLFFMISCSLDGQATPMQLTYVHEENNVIFNHSGELLHFTLADNTLSMIVPNGFVARNPETQEIVLSQDITYVFTKQF